MVLKTISPCCGVWASLMLFLFLKLLQLLQFCSAEPLLSQSTKANVTFLMGIYCRIKIFYMQINVSKGTLCHKAVAKDDPITILCTPWTTPSVTIVRNSYVYAQNYLRMPTVLNSDFRGRNFKYFKTSGHKVFTVHH